jgi:peptidoglycan/LPS O-acetylase OafA/YrhL
VTALAATRLGMNEIERRQLYTDEVVENPQFPLWSYDSRRWYLPSEIAFSSAPTGQPHTLNFKSLEGLRGYMAWTVVFMHVVYFSGYAQQRPFVWLVPLLNGVGAVNVFIVVSGFVITHLILVRNERYRPYLVRRMLRIVPIYYLCLLYSFVAFPAQLELHTNNWVLDRAVWAHDFSMFHSHAFQYVLLHITLLHGVVPDSVLPLSSWQILGPAWSLSLEWQFYLLAPLLVKLLRLNRVAEASAVTMLIACFALFRWRLPIAWNQPAALPLSIHFFLLGILSRIHLPALEKLPRWTIPAVGFSLAVAVRPLRYELLMWTFFFTAVLMEEKPPRPLTVIGRGADHAFKWITRNRFVTSLGRCSYSTYLVHIPFLATVIWIGAHLFGIQSQRSTFVLMLAAMPFLALLSQALYAFVESPFIRMGSQYAAVKPIVPTHILSQRPGG